MKAIYFILLTILSYLLSNATHASVFIVLSSQDCSSYLKYLEDVKNLPNKEQVFIIQSARDKIDSVDFVKVNELTDFGKRMIYSDSLFQKYRLKNQNTQSALIIKSNTSEQYMSVPFVDYPDYTDLVRQHLSDTFDFVFSNQIFGSRSVSEIINNKYMVINELTNEVNVYDILSKESLYTISISDSLLIKVYQATWGKEFKERFERSVGSLEDPSRWKRKNNILTHAYFGPDGKTVYVNTQHAYFWTHTDGEKYGSGFTAISKYENGKFIEVHLIEGFLGHPRGIKTPDDLIGKGIYNGYNFTVNSKGKLYLSILNSRKMDSLPYFFVEMKKEKSSYVVDKIFDSKMDPYYIENKSPDAFFTGGISNSNNDYFMSSYGEYLHHLPTSTKVRLKNFNNDRNNMNVIYSFRKQDKKLYLLCGNELEKSNYYYVYDLEMDKIIYSKRIIAYKDPKFIAGTFFDNFDYSYIYLPTSPTSFQKIKMYNP